MCCSVDEAFPYIGELCLCAVCVPLAGAGLVCNLRNIEPVQPLAPRLPALPCSQPPLLSLPPASTAAKRLMTDDSPRLQAALRYMVRAVLRCAALCASRSPVPTPLPLPALPTPFTCPSFDTPSPAPGCCILHTVQGHTAAGINTAFDAGRLIDLLSSPWLLCPSAGVWAQHSV